MAACSVIALDVKSMEIRNLRFLTAVTVLLNSRRLGCLDRTHGLLHIRCVLGRLVLMSRNPSHGRLANSLGIFKVVHRDQITVTCI